MLILVGVTISITTNSGIISKTKEAAIQMELAQIQEQLVLKKAEVIMDNGGNIPSNYGITLNDLDLPANIKTKYASKLTISQDGTLHYIADAVTEEEIAIFANAGITASGSQTQSGTSSNIEYYALTYQDGSEAIEAVYLVDYVNSKIKIYAGLPNGNLQKQAEMNVEFSTDSFTVLLDNVQTTISNATAIIVDSTLAAYIQNNKAYVGEQNQNSVMEFSTSVYATLATNFDTTRLVDAPESTPTPTPTAALTGTAWGASNTLIIKTSDDNMYLVSNGEVQSLDSQGMSLVEDRYITSFGYTYSTDANEIFGDSNTSINTVNIDTSEEYDFLFANGNPAYIYLPSLDSWNMVGRNNGYIYVVTDCFDAYSGDISEYIAQIETMNNGN